MREEQKELRHDRTLATNMKYHHRLFQRSIHRNIISQCSLPMHMSIPSRRKGNNHHYEATYHSTPSASSLIRYEQLIGMEQSIQDKRRFHDWMMNPMADQVEQPRLNPGWHRCSKRMFASYPLRRGRFQLIMPCYIPVAVFALLLLLHGHDVNAESESITKLIGIGRNTPVKHSTARRVVNAEEMTRFKYREGLSIRAHEEARSQSQGEHGQTSEEEARFLNTFTSPPSPSSPSSPNWQMSFDLSVCTENSFDTFFLRRKQDDETVPIFRTCEWLGGRERKQIICDNDTSSWNDGTNIIGPARDVCKLTCGTCLLASPTTAPSTTVSTSISLSQRPTGKTQSGRVVLPVSSSTNKTSDMRILNTSSARPSLQPTPLPSPKPTLPPTSHPSVNPTNQPSPAPTVSPTAPPTAQPTHRPSAHPSPSPSSFPTAMPTRSPTTMPSSFPTLTSSSRPSVAPTSQPSVQPTKSPTSLPSSSPTSQPSAQPTHSPTVTPSTIPSILPTDRPTSQPSYSPTKSPSLKPTASPSFSPSHKPSSIPSPSPTGKPSASPTSAPTSLPSASPTTNPTASPSQSPTSFPTESPTLSLQPSFLPTSKPSSRPSVSPTNVPTRMPSANPSSSPTSSPSASPSFPLQELEFFLVLQFDDLTEIPGRAITKLEGLTSKTVEDALMDAYDDDFKVSANMKSQASFDFGSLTEDRRRLQTLGLEIGVEVFVEVRSGVIYEKNDTRDIIANAFDTEAERREFFDELQTMDSSFRRINAMEITINNERVELKQPSGNSWVYIASGIGAGAVTVTAFLLFNARRRRREENFRVPNNPPPPPPPVDARVATMIEVDPEEPDMSTLGDPVYGGPTGMYASGVAAAFVHHDDPTNTSNELLAGYDYKKAYGGAGDVPSVASADVKSIAGAQSLGSRVQSLDSSKVSRVSEDPDAQSIFQDDDSFEKMYGEEEIIEIDAPSGKLGVVIDNPVQGAPMVHAIRDTSVLSELIRIGDKLLSVDGEDTTTMTAIQVSKLISSKAMNPRRRMVFLRPPAPY